MRLLIVAAVLAVVSGCTGQFVPKQTVDKVGLAVMQRAGEIEMVTPQ